MKLVVAIVKNEDVDRLTESLVKHHLRATKLASTGGFLRVGNTTLLIGIEENRVDDVIEIIRRSCSAREQYVSSGSYEFLPSGIQRPIEVIVGGATIFVLSVDEFYRFAQTV